MASLLLMRAIQYIPQGVLLGVVDPGVGTVEETNRDRNRMGCNDRTRQWAFKSCLCNSRWRTKSFFTWKTPIGLFPLKVVPFHARDIFSPFAAGYASGQLALEEFGPEVDLGELKQYLIPLTEVTEKHNQGRSLVGRSLSAIVKPICSPEELSGS